MSSANTNSHANNTHTHWHKYQERYQGLSILNSERRGALGNNYLQLFIHLFHKSSQHKNVLPLRQVFQQPLLFATEWKWKYRPRWANFNPPSLMHNLFHYLQNCFAAFKPLESSAELSRTLLQDYGGAATWTARGGWWILRLQIHFVFSLKVENKGQKYRDGWKTDSPTPPTPTQKGRIRAKWKTINFNVQWGDAVN